MKHRRPLSLPLMLLAGVLGLAALVVAFAIQTALDLWDWAKQIGKER